MGILDKIKGLFSKKPDASQVYAEMYEQKSLKEILQEMAENDWPNYESEQRYQLTKKYCEKLFGDPIEEGGFGLKDKPGFSDVVSAACMELARDKTPYKYGVGKNEKIQNYKLEYLKNCLASGCIAKSQFRYTMVIGMIFPLDESPMFSRSELRDPNFPLYHPWVLEGDPKDNDLNNFLQAKLNVIRMITDPEQLEGYGLFRQVDGEPTDEYVTVEDFVGIKNRRQLIQFLDTIQTKDGEGNDLD